MKLITFLILATSVALCCNALPSPQGSPQTSPPPSLGNRYVLFKTYMFIAHMVFAYDFFLKFFFFNSMIFKAKRTNEMVQQTSG